MDFGNYLREKRRAAGLSQVAFAEALGINSTYVSHVECGRLGPFSADLIVRAADVLGCDVDEC
ncbi:MAG: hypothetical protein KatS3mg042_0675 [Rhodothermaceae bacterium]|nr:MAG: hypothetical protein KatS3mg042_0675 [Rhodothermaceae bacterium]